MTDKQTTTAARPQWTERYNCHSLDLGYGLRCSVDWTKWPVTGESAYEIGFNGCTLKRREGKLPEAKRLALQLARRVLTEALARLDAAEQEARNAD